MDPSDAPSSAFSEEEKLPEGIDEDANWFGKTLEDESDNTEHEVLNSQMNQDDLSVELGSVKESDLGEGKVSEQSAEEIMETDSQSELLAEIADGSTEQHKVTLEPKKAELTELKDIAIDGKKHDISNELKEMFEEKSSDAEELQETTLSQHSLDTEITKEDKLKDIVPDDILGKDDSFDGLDNDALHQELEAHLTYEKDKELIPDLPGSSDDLHADEVSVPQVDETEQVESQSQPELSAESEIDKPLEDLNFQGKTDLLKNLAEDIGTKEIDEIMEESSMPSEGETTSKEITSDLKEISTSLDESCVADELKNDLENQLQNITGEPMKEQESTSTEEIVTQVDKSNIELDQENMMVEFTHDSDNPVLIQINNEQSEAVSEEAEKTDDLEMETLEAQKTDDLEMETLAFSTEPMEMSTTESDMVSQVEGGEEFLQAVTGKLEEVLVPVKEEPVNQESVLPEEPAVPVAEPKPAPVVVRKEVLHVPDSPKCCITSCKSGKSSLKTTFRYFKPPTNNILYKKWEYIFNQARQQISPNSLICELHFRTGLIYKKGTDKQGRVNWALREGALPKLSPSGVLRVSGGVIPPPSTTVQVQKKTETVTKTSVAKPTTPLAETKTVSSNVAPLKTTTPKILGKKVLQKPVKTVATKVSNEVTDIGFLYKNPELVKVAQDEISNLDLLVCGECHSVFHILELFQAHKMANNCKGESNFKGNPSEPKPQVWAFLLWKSAQAKVSDVESSWRLYQRWCKMDEKIRNTWIAAGRTLQQNSSVSCLKLVESSSKSKAGRPSARERDSEDDDYTSRRVKRPKIQSRVSTQAPEVDLGGAGDASTFSESEPTEVENTHVSPAKPVEEAHEVDQTLEDLSRHTPEMITAEVEIKQEIMSDDEHEGNKENDQHNKYSDEVQNCSKCREPVTNPRHGILCASGCYGYFHVECTRVRTMRNLSRLGSKKQGWKCDTCRGSDSAPLTPKAKPQLIHVPETSKPREKGQDEEEFVVEKIVSRRYNIKKKHFEYLLKWEGYPSEQNTWEPAENLGTCQHLLKAFEEALAKQQAAKQAAANNRQGLPNKPEPAFKIKPPLIPKKKPDPSTPGPSTPLVNSLGRPVRSSKQKAMDQVKVWCGSIVRPTEDENDGNKRKASSDSEFEEEVVVKRVKVEMESEESDTDSMRTIERTPLTPNRGRARPPGAINTARVSAQALANYANKPVVNGDQKQSNLAAALGLESDEDEDRVPSAPSSPVKSPVVRKMSALTQHNQQVLVASAKGVVSVDPKQVPNLSSGVYIMSNKSGIVKVDNNKTLNTLQKSGVMKKPVEAPTQMEISITTGTSGSGVVVLPKSDGSAPQQKVGVVRRSPAEAANVGRPTITPRPLGLLKPPVSVTPSRPPITSPIRSLGTPSGFNTKIQQVVRPRQPTPLRGRGGATPLLRRPLPESPALQASMQQKLLIARKKAETEGGEGKPSVTISPVKKEPESTVVRIVPSPAALPPIRSTNKVLAHPLLSRGRGRGGFRGRGRGSSLGHMLQTTPREVPIEPVKESKLVESDNLLMEFQEPSDSEDSDDGVNDMFPNLEDLPPIEPDSPPRPMSLCPLTGRVLCKAEGERTPEPTPPPSPKPPTPPPVLKQEPEPTHILPDQEVEESVTVAVVAPTPVTVTPAITRPVATPTTTVSKKPAYRKQSRAPASRPKKEIPQVTHRQRQESGSMICKVEMSPGGTTGTLVEATTATAGVTEGTVTIKKPLASRNRINRGPQLSVMSTDSGSTSLGTITVPARKLFQEEGVEDDIVTITGEDGLVYQVSNTELAGNTLLVSSGEDGQQQCVYVTTEGDCTEDGSTILTLDTAYADAVAQLGTDQVNILSTENGDQYYIKEGDDGSQLVALEGGDSEGIVCDDQSGQVVAQLVEAGEPAPGGSRRVVLLLPDGNLMMTEVDEEQYAALDLDK